MNPEACFIKQCMFDNFNYMPWLCEWRSIDYLLFLIINIFITLKFSGLENLPTELQRNFHLMRDLDQRSQDVMRNIDQVRNVD